MNVSDPISCRKSCEKSVRSVHVSVILKKLRDTVTSVRAGT